MRLVYLYLVLLSFLFARKGNGLPPPQFVFANEANAISDYGSPNSIITGIYGIGKNSPKIAVHTPDGLEGWSWDWASDGVQKANTHMKNFPDISQCISKYWSNWKSATDVKFTREQDLIAAIYSDAAVVFKHAPDNKDIDKKIVFAVCLYGGLRHAHTIEFVRGNKLAISTTGPSASDGFWVYDLNAPLTNSPRPIQKVAGLSAIHGLIWDEYDGVLWANGNDKPLQGDQYHPSRGILQGYPLNHTTGQFIEDIGLRFEFPEANPMDIEWPGWWEGPHEIATVPNERKFLVTTDLDLYSFDLNLRRFERGLSVQQQYINGFVPVDCRTGVNPQNLEKWLPRSGIKGLSLAPNGDFLYIQAPWRDSESLGKQLNVVRGGGGEKSKPYKGSTVYRSHWFVDIPSWPKAKN